ncbi:transcriptional repressor [Solwaraspora sp. WMMA2080]|nr:MULTISPECIES: transcriptional repressor [unclassified Solwaraspora]WBC00304.1 transcriptional repressor [Solwaraspora sp. WMMA2059]WBC23626.1 transcriptional repressor [Solwaraspora sp. WMMA2080]
MYKGVGVVKQSPAEPGRSTRQRNEILTLLDATAEFRSAQQLYAELRARGSTVGLTTVYRTLQVFANAGQVDVMHGAGGEQLYRRCSQTEHHHLVCRLCARTVEVAGPPTQEWIGQVADEHGFTDVNYMLELFGVCINCARRGDD